MTSRRILVALDPSQSARGALEVAAKMAALGDVELVGLYVEDLALLQAAALPVTSLIQRHSSKPRDMVSAEMERAFRVAAREARAMLSEISDRLRIKASFEVQRGPVPSEMLAAACHFDMVSIGTTGRPGSQAGSVARVLIAAGPCSVLISRRPVRAGGPVTLLVEHGPRRIALARELSLIRPHGLRIFRPAGEADLDRRFDAPTRDLIERLERSEVEELPPGTQTDRVMQLLGRRPAGILMIDRGGAFAALPEINRLLSQGLADALLLYGTADQATEASASSKAATTGA